MWQLGSGSHGLRFDFVLWIWSFVWGIGNNSEKAVM